MVSAYIGFYYEDTSNINHTLSTCASISVHMCMYLISKEVCMHVSIHLVVPEALWKDCAFYFLHTIIHTYIHTYIRTYVRTYIQAKMHAYIRPHVHAYLCTYLLTHIHPCFHACIHAQMLIHT